MNFRKQNHSTESLSKNGTEETPEERDNRIDAMLTELVVEKGLEAIINNDEPEPLSRTEIAEFVGCSRETIRRIEINALSKMKKHWS